MKENADLETRNAERKTGKIGAKREARNAKVEDSRFPIPDSRLLPLSVYMITYNNGPTIEKALASAAGWAAEVVVVDSESADGAQEIIRRYTDRLYQLCTADMAEKYGYAQSLCTQPWVLFVDADEWLTDEIKKEIEETIDRTGYDGFNVYRKNMYLGRMIRHGGWYPDYEVRLYRKDKGRWEGGIHARVRVEGRIGRLKHYYLHAPYQDTSHQIRTVERYSQAYAEDMMKADRHFRLFNLLGRPLYRFVRDYLFKGGFLDGMPGLIIVATTMYYVFMKQAKLWELERGKAKR